MNSREQEIPLSTGVKEPERILSLCAMGKFTMIPQERVKAYSKKMLKIMRSDLDPCWGELFEKAELRYPEHGKIVLLDSISLYSEEDEVEVGLLALLEIWKKTIEKELLLSSQFQMHLFFSLQMMDHDVLMKMAKKTSSDLGMLYGPVRKGVEAYVKTIAKTCAKVFSEHFPITSHDILSQQERIISDFQTACEALGMEEHDPSLRKRVNEQVFAVDHTSFLGKIHDHPSNRTALLQQIREKHQQHLLEQIDTT